MDEVAVRQITSGYADAYVPVKSGQTVHHLRQPETRRLPDVQTRTVTVHPSLQRLTYFIYANESNQLETKNLKGPAGGATVTVSYMC